MGQTVYVLMSSFMYHGEESDSVDVYSSLERAREAMLNDIETSKRDNFWWDTESESVRKNFVIESYDNSFEVYYDGDSYEGYEGWFIEPRVMDSGLSTETAAAPSEM
jgi:hypothetical protein